RSQGVPPAQEAELLPWAGPSPEQRPEGLSLRSVSPGAGMELAGGSTISLWTVVAAVQALERSVAAHASRLFSLEHRAGNSEKKHLDCEKMVGEFGNQLESKCAALGTLVQEYGRLQRRLENMENLLKNRNLWILRLPPGVEAPAVALENNATGFSTQEWENLEEWQRELYGKVLTGKREALVLLGECCCWVGYQHFQTGSGWGIFPILGKQICGNTVRPRPHCQGHHCPMSPSATSTWLLNPSSNGDSTSALGSCATAGRPFPGRNFPNIQHQTSHTGERPYKCSKCDKTYRRKDYLLNHQRRHTGERLFQCPLCSKRFVLKRSLLKHQEGHMQDTHVPLVSCRVRPRYSPAAPSQGPRPRSTVRGCGKSFARHAYLLRHQRTHSGQRPHACAECGRRFLAKPTLNSHLRTHFHIIRHQRAGEHPE
uniref:Uncharacterized protein n=1 Tax=Corvus moneduloides TaxID=1196302 RepID=A0A8U7ME35_CORMO